MKASEWLKNKRNQITTNKKKKDTEAKDCIYYEPFGMFQQGGKCWACSYTNKKPSAFGYRGGGQHCHGKCEYYVHKDTEVNDRGEPV